MKEEDLEEHKIRIMERLNDIGDEEPIQFEDDFDDDDGF